MSVQKIMELFGPEFDDVIPFCKKIDFLFEHHKKELDHVVKTTEFLNHLLKVFVTPLCEKSRTNQ